MKIYTKTGDDGTTGLFGGPRVKKSSLRVNVYGTIDELNAHIGHAITCESNTIIKDTLLFISKMLFVAGSDVATPENSKINISRITPTEIIFLENKIDSFNIQLPELKNFILPGGTQSSSIIHIARTVCRRAERLAVELSEAEQINLNIVIFLKQVIRFSIHGIKIV